MCTVNRSRYCFPNSSSRRAFSTPPPLSWSQRSKLSIILSHCSIYVFVSSRVQTQKRLSRSSSRWLFIVCDHLATMQVVWRLIQIIIILIESTLVVPMSSAVWKYLKELWFFFFAVFVSSNVGGACLFGTFVFGKCVVHLLVLILKGNCKMQRELFYLI